MAALWRKIDAIVKNPSMATHKKQTCKHGNDKTDAKVRIKV